MDLYTGGPELLTGAELLDQVDTFVGRFVAYPSEHARLAHVLWIAHAHFMDAWESTPRIAFLSPEPGSGKSRCLEVTEPLVPRPVHAVNTTPAYLFRKVSDEAGPPTILYDEIDTVFGPKAKDNEDIRGMLNAGHRRGAVAGHVGRLLGMNVVTDPNIPLTLGTSLTEDVALVYVASDIWLWESGLRAEAFTSPMASSMGVFFRVYNYASLICERYNSSLGQISGSGMVAPVFSG